MSTTTAEAAIGHRIRRLRQAQGLSRTELARRIEVDVSSIAGWESGKRLPRETVRPRLADALACALSQLMSPAPEAETPTHVAALNSLTEFPPVLMAAVRTMRRNLRAVRLTRPDSTAVLVLREFRQLVCERILADTVMVQRIEIFYTLDRLKETLSNILRYDGHQYYIRTCCVGLKEVAPFLGGYCIDDDEVILGTYHAIMPPQGYSVLHLKGPAVGHFFQDHWREIWARGTLLNPHGAHDLSAVREVALSLGLPPRRWRAFVEEARTLEIGDGAPPLI
jgi:transcriptional regulator with XRE-family HTH domain